MSDKRKFQLFVSAIPVVLILVYQLAIRRTLELRSEYNDLAARVALMENMPIQTAQLRKKSHVLDSLLRARNIGDTSLENNLIRMLSSFSDSLPVIISDFNPTHEAQQDGIKVRYYNFTLKGTFTALLHTLHALELNGSFGQVASIHLRTERPIRSRAKELYVDIWLQKIE